MHRRTLLAAAVTLAALPHRLRAAGTEDYAPGLAEDAMEKGEVILLDFKADWCTTCAAQERVIDALRKENPAYDAVRFINVDWDAHGDGKLARSLNIPRRSTLVALKGKTEIGRLVAATGKAEIKALLDAALAAATA
jgi:thiol-disulfide isomerase/thioredoxin